MSTETPHKHSIVDADAFVMPENHLDLVVTPGSIDTSRAASLRTRLIAVISMPLFFLLTFSLCYVSATHAPEPHDLALTVVGPASVTQQIADTIDSKAPGAFDITRRTDATAAKKAVAERAAVGAVIVDGTKVTTVIASGGGRLTVPVVENVGTQIATSLGSTASVEDVAPLPAQDPGGSVLFLFVVICTVGAFLSVTSITQAFRTASVRAMLATVVGAAVVVPVLGFSMISVYVDFGVNFGTVAGVLGVGMLYTLTVGVVATLLTVLAGQGSIFAVILLLVGLNFPSAGGTAPESMLPPFWQVVHNFWIGSSGFESMRSIMFFHGHQLDRWLPQLLIWAGAAVLLLAVVTLSKRRRAAAELASAPTQASAPAPDISNPPLTDASVAIAGGARRAVGAAGAGLHAVSHE